MTQLERLGSFQHMVMAETEVDETSLGESTDDKARG